MAATGQGERLRRADRIRDPRDFRRLQREGRRRSSRHFVAVVGPGWEPGRTRLGLAVSRRVGGAVGRNRVKRRVREWFRRRRGELPAGCDVVVIARSGAVGLSSEEIARELEGLAR